MYLSQYRISQFHCGRRSKDQDQAPFLSAQLLCLSTSWLPLCALDCSPCEAIQEVVEYCVNIMIAVSITMKSTTIQGVPWCCGHQFTCAIMYGCLNDTHLLRMSNTSIRY